MGKKRVNGTVRFAGGGIELAPGTAVEWTAATYPFTQDTGPGGRARAAAPARGAARQPVRYRWSNGAFTK